MNVIQLFVFYVHYKIFKILIFLPLILIQIIVTNFSKHKISLFIK